MFGTGLPSLEIAGLAVGVREGVLALIFLVALYIGLVLFRMRRLTGQTPSVDNREPPRVGAASQDVAASSSEPVVTHSDDEDDAAFQQASSRMANELLNEGLERELAQLRNEVDIMRGELAALREDMLQEMAHLRATQTVSPIYGDAMQMATAGYDAAMIAERCGIARAEAELVVALARSQVQ